MLKRQRIDELWWGVERPGVQVHAYSRRLVRGAGAAAATRGRVSATARDRRASRGREARPRLRRASTRSPRTCCARSGVCFERTTRWSSYTRARAASGARSTTWTCGARRSVFPRSASILLSGRRKSSGAAERGTGRRESSSCISSHFFGVTTARKFTKTDDYLACALIPISTRSPRWRDAWADDIDTRRDTFLSFFLTRNALSALWEHRDDEEGISVFDDDDSGNCPLAWRVWVGLCRLDCDADLIAEVVRVLPYNYERLAGDVRLAEDCLKGFEYDRAWDHDDNFRFEAHYSATHVLPMRPGEALLNLGHASGRVAPRGVARS